MKKMYKKEEGVSPVIATILMVAITVVLAATVWLLVSGYMTPSAPPLQGSLQYDYQSSNLDAGYVNLTILLSQPSNGISPNDVNLNINGTDLTYSASLSSDKTWTYIDSDGNGKLSNGDTIIIRYANADHGNSIALGATGYSGSIKTTIP
ncbi:type IV pilin [Euryarchaeota archaeon ex4484_178]|nr:MAG: type IV pilin [Euryarchaeota archaeon ex4484_178]